MRGTRHWIVIGLVALLALGVGGRRVRKQR